MSVFNNAFDWLQNANVVFLDVYSIANENLSWKQALEQQKKKPIIYIKCHCQYNFFPYCPFCLDCFI